MLGDFPFLVLQIEQERSRRRALGEAHAADGLVGELAGEGDARGKNRSPHRGACGTEDGRESVHLGGGNRHVDARDQDEDSAGDAEAHHRVAECAAGIVFPADEGRDDKRRKKRYHGEHVAVGDDRPEHGEYRADGCDDDTREQHLLRDLAAFMLLLCRKNARADDLAVRPAERPRGMLAADSGELIDLRRQKPEQPDCDDDNQYDQNPRHWRFPSAGIRCLLNNGIW